MAPRGAYGVSRRSRRGRRLRKLVAALAVLVVLVGAAGLAAYRTGRLDDWLDRDTSPAATARPA